MLRTRAGYAGDPRKDQPTYHDLGLHAETLEVDFDPAVISYEELLDIFWNSHNPTSSAWSPQYRSAVFTHDAAQAEAARRSADRYAGLLGREVRTEITPLSRFWPAEEYHQKYRLQHNRLLRNEYREIYPVFKDFLNSTAVARVNGYLGGYGSSAQLDQELDRLGLDERGRQELRSKVGSRRR